MLCDWKPAFVVAPPGIPESIVIDVDAVETLVGAIPVVVAEYVPPSTYRTL